MLLSGGPVWCVMTPNRRTKTRRLMQALARGIPRGELKENWPSDLEPKPFIVWGQRWLAVDLIRKHGASVDYMLIDNGYWRPAGGTARGYYRMTYRGLSPIYWRDAPRDRARASEVRFAPWRESGSHILLAYPGPFFGAALGLDMGEWSSSAAAAIARHTDRSIRIRDKSAADPLSEDLRDAWALVTHSSVAAVHAAIAGIPVFVAETSAALPIGNASLADIERPAMPDNREAWWASLMCQQFTIAEMARGVAYDHMIEVERRAASGRRSIP